MSNIKMKGKTTKNHEIPVYPLLHKKFKNHVHKNMKIALLIIDITDDFVIVVKKPRTAITRYTIAGVQKEEMSIIYMCYIFRTVYSKKRFF